LNRALPHPWNATRKLQARRSQPQRQLKQPLARLGLQQGGPANVADQRSHVARLHLRDRARIQPVFIAKRQVIEQIFNGLDSALGKVFGDAFAHSLHILHRRG